MDKSLDEILADQRKSSGRPRGQRGNQRGGQRRQESSRNDTPRDGVRKSYRDRDEGPRNLESEWVHDRYEDNGRRPRQARRGRDRDSPEPPTEQTGTTIRVENVHYDLSYDDLYGLFNRIAPIVKLDIKYDRAGRSTGDVFVTYELYEDAQTAVREFDGANAKGQPIRLKILPPRGKRSLAERITMQPARGRSRSPGRDMEDEASRNNIDRYVPGRRRSRSPIRGRGRERGRRPGARRGAGPRDAGDRPGRDGRPKKTQDELDAEMDDYFNANQQAGNGGGQAAVPEEDVDMIE